MAYAALFRIENGIEVGKWRTQDILSRNALRQTRAVLGDEVEEQAIKRAGGAGVAREGHIGRMRVELLIRGRRRLCLVLGLSRCSREGNMGFGVRCWAVNRTWARPFGYMTAALNFRAANREKAEILALSRCGTEDTSKRVFG